ncbi:MAG: hypothetical protein EOM54_01910 [Clostridia bacterium]|nr:hypothetical protein [Clostridia bacterium]
MTDLRVIAAFRHTAYYGVEGGVAMPRRNPLCFFFPWPFWRPPCPPGPPPRPPRPPGPPPRPPRPPRPPGPPPRHR